MSRAPWLVLAAIVVAAALADVVEALLGVSAVRADLVARALPPSWPHLLGTNEVGQDVLARVLHGARVSLSIGAAAAIASTLIGGLVGVVAAARGGFVDAALMRATDLVAAIPTLPLLILLSAVDVGARGAAPDALRVVVLLALFGWTTTARVARAAALSARASTWVEAARALGASEARVVVAHLVPAALPALLVAGALDVGANVIAEASLSFLGLGVRPPTPSLGALLGESVDALRSGRPLPLLAPAAVLVAAVASLAALAARAQEALDPRTRIDELPPP